MAGIFVGGEKCSISSILKLFGQPPMSDVIVTEWNHFAVCLETPSGLRKKIKLDLQLDKITYFDAVDELLLNWVSRNSSEATLENLLEIICDLHWNVVKDFLQQKIRHHATNWNDLDKESQNVILNSEVQFLGRTETLISLKSVICEDRFRDILSKYFGKDNFPNWDKPSTIKLDNIRFPRTPNYYVERKIKYRRKINRRMFEERCQDVFVFEGLEHHQLSMLAKSEMTDTSGNQAQEITVRFILLECETDFSKIVSICEFPLHRIKYQNDSFYWVSTFGSLNLIQTFLTNEDEESTENGFVKEHISTFKNRPFVICSSPGMGKSVLLQNLANRVRETFSESFVILLQLCSLISWLKSWDDDSDSAIELLASAISMNVLGKQLLLALLNKQENRFELFLDGFDEITLESHFSANVFLKCLLNQKNIRVYITSRKHFQRELEKTIGVISLNISPFSEEDQTNFLHMYWKPSIENKYHQNLPTFASKVIQSLSKLDADEDFAGIPLQCYMIAQVYLNDVKRSCNLSSSSFQVQNPSKSLFELYTNFIEFRFHSIPTKDSKVLRKLHWREALILLYPDSFEAVQIRNELMKEVEDASLHEEQVFTVGLLEQRETGEGPVFVHRTFAEYFIAELITEILLDSQCTYKNYCMKFLFDAVLAYRLSIKETEVTDDIKEIIAEVIESSEMWKTRSNEFKRVVPALFRNEHFPFTHIRNLKVVDILDFWKFQNPDNAVVEFLVKILYYIRWKSVAGNKFIEQFSEDLLAVCSPDTQLGEFYNTTVCFFLDSNLGRNKCFSEQHLPLEGKFRESAKLIMQAAKKGLVSILLVSTNQGCKFLVKLVLDFCLETSEMESIVSMEHSFCEQLILCAAKNADFTLFDLCCKILGLSKGVLWYNLQFHNFKIKQVEFIVTPIHEAVKNGNYKLTEYLLKYYSSQTRTNGLWQICINESWNDSKFVISNKIQILLLLHAKNLISGIIPLETNMPRLVAVELFIKICDLFDYVPCNEDAKAIHANRLLYPLNEFQMDTIVDWLIAKNRLEVLTHNVGNEKVGEDYFNLLQQALTLNVICPKILTKIYSCLDFDLGSIFFMAVTCKKNTEIVKSIVHLTGNPDIIDTMNQSLLHFAAATLRFNVMQYILSVGANVNLRNEQQATPLHLVFSGTGISPSFHSIHDFVQLLVEHDADVQAKDRYGNTPLSIALARQKELNIESRTLILLGQPPCLVT